MPKSLTMSKMHEPPLRHLTGCWYAVIVHLAKLFKAVMSKKSLAFLGAIQFKAPSQGEVLVVDTTSTRVASTQDSHYSGYKHHKCAKVQVIVNTAGAVLHISKPLRKCS